MVKKFLGLLIIFGIVLLTGIAGGVERDTIDLVTLFVLTVISIGSIVSGYIGLRIIGGFDSE